MKEKSNPKQRKEHRILGGHTKDGNKFSCLPNKVKPVSHVHHIVPELIWLAILNEGLGIQLAARVVEIIGSIIKTEPEQKAAPPLFATCMAALAPSYYNRILAQLSKENLLETVRFSLKPFIGLYPQFPIAWLGGTSPDKQDRQYLPQFKRLLGELQNKTTKTSTLMVAQNIYGALISKTILLRPGMIDDFDEIRNYPETDSSQKLGATCRAINITLMGERLLEPGFTLWSSYFWQRGLELEPVDYTNLLRGLHE